MNTQLTTGPGEPTLFAQTVARDILRKAREMDQADVATKFSNTSGTRIWRELKTGGKAMIVVSKGQTRAEFGDLELALESFIRLCQSDLVDQNRYETTKTVMVPIEACGSDNASIEVLGVAPLLLPPSRTGGEALTAKSEFVRMMTKLLESPPSVSKPRTVKKART